jgi:hypothetical protein
LDDGPAGTIPYNWVYTNYDPRTGAESNLVGTVAVPTPTTPKLDVLRGAVNITPAAYGNAAVRQRFYRLGGTITDNWYFSGVNASDGGVYLDSQTDAFVFGTGLTAPVTHFQPVATVDASGNTVLAQPVPALWGPIQGMLLACGDPYRPGWIYASFPNQPDHWLIAVEVCEPTTPLQNGCLYGDRAFVFSTEQGYAVIPNLSTGGGLTTLPTACKHGLASVWGIGVGIGGIYICSRDGIFVTDGTNEGIPISDDLWPLFDPHQVGAINGYYPIDFTHPEAIRVHPIGLDIWFGYRDTNGGQQWMIYSLIYQQWRHYGFGQPVAEVYVEEGIQPQSVLLGERTGGIVDQHSGFTDRGALITGHLRTGALNQGAPRSDKRYGNWVIDVDQANATATVQAFSNDEATSYAAMTLAIGSPNRHRVIVDPFGGTTVRAPNLSLDIQVGSATGTPILYLAELAYAMEAADYVLWETDEIDHGIPGWHTPLWASFAVRAPIATSLTLLRTVYDDRLNVLLTDSYVLTVTPVKSHQYVPFQAMKGALFSYRITASVPPFRIYEAETSMTVQPLSGGPPITVRPFGTTDPTNLTASGLPMLAALRAGGAS